MKESLYSQWKPVERYTFNSEQDTRRQGTVVGTPTFSNWTMTTSAVWNYINTRYDFSWKTKFTVRIKWSPIANISISQWDDNNNRVDFRIWNNAVNWEAFIICNAWNSFMFTPPNTTSTTRNVFFVYDGAWATNEDRAKVYVNWVLATPSFTWTIPSSCPKLTSKNARIWNTYSWWYLTNNWTIEFAEIYNYAWTASQVANDYNNSTYKDIRNWLVLDIDSRQGVIEDKIGNTFTNTLVKLKKKWPYQHMSFPIAWTWFLNFWDNIKYELNDMTIFFWITHSSLATTNIIWAKYNTVWDKREYQYAVNSTSINFVKSSDWTVANAQSVPYVFAPVVWKIYCFWFTKSWVNYAHYINWASVANWTFTNATIFHWDAISELSWQNTWTSNLIKWDMPIFRLYNRALSANEIMNLYTSQKPYFL